jgi:hypothetical protein
VIEAASFTSEPSQVWPERVSGYLVGSGEAPCELLIPHLGSQMPLRYTMVGPVGATATPPGSVELAVRGCTEPRGAQCERG